MSIAIVGMDGATVRMPPPTTPVTPHPAPVPRGDERDAAAADAFWGTRASGSVAPLF